MRRQIPRRERQLDAERLLDSNRTAVADLLKLRHSQNNLPQLEKYQLIYGLRSCCTPAKPNVYLALTHVRQDVVCKSRRQHAELRRD